MEIKEIPANDFEALSSVHPDGTAPKLSARLYEFFFTTFAQHNMCSHRGINIGEEYLKNSKHFTFFRRQPDVVFGIKADGCEHAPLKVTRGQLALFRWIYDHDIHNYIVLHLSTIRSAQQNFKKIPRSQITNESITLDNLTSSFAALDVNLSTQEDTIKLGVPRNRRFHNREVITRKHPTKQPPPSTTVDSLKPLDSVTDVREDDVNRAEHKRKQDENLIRRRTEQIELQRLANIKRLERQQEELRLKDQRALQKQIEKEAAKEAKKQSQERVRRPTLSRQAKTRQQEEQVSAPAEWLFPALPSDSRFRPRLGW